MTKKKKITTKLNSDEVIENKSEVEQTKIDTSVVDVMDIIVNNTGIEFLEQREVIKKGHFKLSSGLHSDTYFQIAKLFEQPYHAQVVISDFIQKNKLKDYKFDKVISPAMGAILVGYEVARQLKVPNVFFERVNGEFTLKRGFDIEPESKVLIMEDVITTGKSYKEIIEKIAHLNCEIYVGCIINRSNIKLIDFDLHKIQPRTFEPDSCKLCKDGKEISVQGSRFNI